MAAGNAFRLKARLPRRGPALCLPGSSRFWALLSVCMSLSLTLVVGCDRELAKSSQDVFAEEMHGHLRRLDRMSAPGRDVFVGGSTFQALDIAAITANGLNLSVGGETLGGMITRVRGFRSITSARSIIINLGFNDLMRNCESVDTTSISDLRSSMPIEASLFVVGVQIPSLAVGSRKCGGQLTTLAKRFNEDIERLCRGLVRCQFVPHPTAVLSGDDDPSRLLDADGIHLSEAGYRQLEERIRSALRDIGTGVDVSRGGRRSETRRSDAAPVTPISTFAWLVQA